MKRTSIALVFVATLGLAALDSAAAKRFGGGGNVGKQRAAPTATKDAATASGPAQAAPAQSATPAPAAAAPAAAAAKPSFMSRWGGLLAGLGIGVLLASLFGAQMGPIIGLLLGVLLVGLLAFALFRLFAGKRAPPQPQERPVQFAGIGSAIQAPPGGAPAAAEPAVEPVQRRAIAIPDFEVAPFVRVAKTSFIRLQAANDSGDLEDIRDYTTPEIYAEIAMQLKERQGSQKTEVVSLDADVVEAVVEDGYEIASVRFWGLIRENDASNPEPFDELWHVRRKAGDRKAPWLIAGIQQQAA
jgi:predicted lipid-binding transport protein (Tim44 family)